MNSVTLQIWEESDINDGIRQDGCSLHLDDETRKRYIEDYRIINSSKELPSNYERPVGSPSDVFITEDLYLILSQKGSIRLMQNELNNLFSMDDIILKD